MSSRSSILRSAFAASSKAYGGKVKAPFFGSTGGVSGSGNGSDGSFVAIGTGRLIGVGVGLDEAAFNAAAAADTIAAVLDGFGGASAVGAGAFARTGIGALAGSFPKCF